MSSFSLNQFEIDFADYLDLFNIRRDTTDQDIAVAITAVMTTYDGEARFDPAEAEAHFKAQRDNCKRLAELSVEELEEKLFDAPDSRQELAALELLLEPQVMERFYLEEGDTND